MRDEENRWECSFGPFRLTSAIDLTGLRLAGDQGGLPVEIRLGRLDLGLPGAERVSPWVVAGANVCGLEVPGLARFAVTDGDTVVVDIVPGADVADVRGYLTAWVFGALCHQNGMLPLHASAIESKGEVTAFLGDSGAGKSTLAAFLAGRGYRIWADDICLLREKAEGMNTVPVAEWLKLWRGTMEALGQDVRAQDRTYSDEDKYKVYRAAETGREDSAVLRNVVFVERGEGAARLERISNATALGRMMSTVYLGYCMRAMGIESRAFRQSARVLEQAQAWVLTAPWGFAAMEGVVDLLEERLLGGKAGIEGES